MKTIKNVLVSLFILALVLWAGYTLSRNKANIQYQATQASQTISEIPVRVIQPALGSLKHQVFATGILSPAEELIVVSETGGKILKYHKQVGEVVRKNDVLVEVEDEIIRASVLVAEANYEQLKKDIARYERLEQGNAIAKHDLEQARIGLKKAEADLIKAEKALKDTKITSPIAGVVNQRMVETGQFVSPGLPVYEIVNTGQLKIWIKIPEKDIFKISKGQEVMIKVPSLSGDPFRGRVTSLGEKADRSMKFDVEVTLENRPGKDHMKAGLYAEVTIPVKASEALIIDKAAITGSLTEPSVFVIEDGKASLRNIRISDSNDKQVEVVSGLTGEDRVIVGGQLNLREGNAVKIIQ